MSQVLNQDEIDALLGGLEEGPEEEIETPTSAQEEEGIIPYDFVNAARLTRVKFPAFDVINDQFSRGLRSTLSSLLRLMVDSTVVPTEVITFKEFLRRVPVPSSLHVLKMDPLRGHVLLVVDSQLVFCIVEIFLGSSKFGQIRIEGREFTSIERRLIRRIVNSLLSDLERAWRPIYPVTIQYVRGEINPQFAKIAQEDDTVIISKFQVDLEEISGVISLCIPLGMLQPIKNKLESSFQGDEAEDPVWRQRLIQNLRQIDLELRVPLGEAQITGSELLDLSIGDIIQLDTNVDDLLLGFIDGIPKVAGHPGLYRGQRALRVEKLIRSPDDI